MPEQQPAPVAPVGGYPPMATLRWAPPGWPMNGALTPLTSPDAARLALRAESETSVLDPVGMRRLWVRESFLGFGVAGLVLAVVASVDFVQGGDLPWWWPLLMVAALFGNLLVMGQGALWRAVPGRELMPRLGRGRLRWYLDLWRRPRPRRLQRQRGLPAQRLTPWCPGWPAWSR